MPQLVLEWRPLMVVDERWPRYVREFLAERPEFGIGLVNPGSPAKDVLHLIAYPARRHREIVAMHQLANFVKEQELAGRNIAVIACDNTIPAVRNSQVERLVLEQAGEVLSSRSGRWRSESDVVDDLYSWLRAHLPKPAVTENPLDTTTYSTENILDNTDDDSRQGIWDKGTL